MQTAAEYIDRTETAMQHLFAGVDSYIAILRATTGLVFVTSTGVGPEHDAEFAAWQVENTERLEAARAAEREFVAESFALDTLCGAILQVAEKALEIYSSNTTVPPGLPSNVKAVHAKYCVGRSIRTVPLGLIVYAARNQHAHFNEGDLREPSASVFRLLATAHGYGGEREIVDPAFDITNPRLHSLAGNVTSLIGWRSYRTYVSDMRQMLEI
jgi:hypothetical protein